MNQMHHKYFRKILGITKYRRVLEVFFRNVSLEETAEILGRRISICEQTETYLSLLFVFAGKSSLIRL